MPITSKSELHAYIQADIEGRDLDGKWRARYRITERLAYYQWLLRRSEYWSNCRGDLLGRVVGMVLRLRVKLLGERLGFSVPRNVFGPKLILVHAGTVVVHPDARVGEHCRIHHGVTIGTSRGRSPIVEDHVWIGPGATIFGGITVGRDAAIGANAVVMHDVPAGATVAGNPARVVSYGGHAAAGALS